MGRDDLGFWWEFRYRARQIDWRFAPLVAVSIGLVVWGMLGWIGLPK